MLKRQPKNPPTGPGHGRIAIVASRYNGLYVNGMVRAARAVLEGAKVEVHRVPGAFEIPVAAGWLLDRPVGKRPDAILCLGLVWQGETAHADHVVAAVTEALMSLQVASGVPCIHEVLQVRTVEQARARCLDPATNRGIEAARTALEMLRLRRRIPPPGE